MQLDEPPDPQAATVTGVDEPHPTRTTTDIQQLRERLTATRNTPASDVDHAEVTGALAVLDWLRGDTPPEDAV